MAQKVDITLVDDIDGSLADESVSFGLDGKEYVIDLSTKNAEKLRKALAPYVDTARKTTSRRRSAGLSTNGVSASAIRTWARVNGHTDISDRGRVPAAVRDAYNAAH